MKAVFLAVLLGCFGFAAEKPVRELSTQALPFPNSIIPLFRHGYLILFPTRVGQRGPAPLIRYGFTAYDPDGRYVYQEMIELPGGRQAVVHDVDFDTEGNAAVSAAALGGPSGFLAGIVLLDHSGVQTAFIDTGRYVPSSIAIASDRSIWALGWQRDAGKPASVDRQDYMIIHHFSADGKELKRYLPRSAFPPGLEPGGLGPEVHIEATHDRVGILACSGETSANPEWLELDLNGNLLYRARIDDMHDGVGLAAFTADGHVYVVALNGEVSTLDHRSHTWKPIPKRGVGFLLGADGNSLVYKVQDHNQGPIQLQWFNQP